MNAARRSNPWKWHTEDLTRWTRHSRLLTRLGEFHGSRRLTRAGLSYFSMLPTDVLRKTRGLGTAEAK